MIPLPKTLTRFFVKTHREINFIYGESQNETDDTDVGIEICRGEPNTYNILTCVCFSRKPEDRFFKTVVVHGVIRDYIKRDIERIPLDNEIVVVHKIGEGNSLMKEQTPELYEFMITKLKKHLEGCKKEVVWF